VLVVLLLLLLLLMQRKLCICCSGCVCLSRLFPPTQLLFLPPSVARSSFSSISLVVLSFSSIVVKLSPFSLPLPPSFPPPHTIPHDAAFYPHIGPLSSLSFLNKFQ